MLALSLGVALAWSPLSANIAFGQSTPAAVRSILAAPEALLDTNPNGGPRLVSQIRDLAIADRSSLQVILNLLAKANKEQKSAIGAGLGQAARVLVRTDPAYANEIQRAIAETKDQDVVLAYTSAAGDQAIAAVGTAGSAGAIGGQTNALPGGPLGTGPAQLIGGQTQATGQFTYSSSVSSTTASTSVSP
jgi:hypothetical protein